MCSDSMSINCLAPQKKAAGDLSENNQSLVLLLECCGARFLFTGDTEIEMEEKILEGQWSRWLKADILKAGHHGSSTSCSADFLEAAGPKAAVISCGEDNAYGHPHEETLQRLSDRGTDIYITAESGAITVKAEDEIRLIEFKR